MKESFRYKTAQQRERIDKDDKRENFEITRQKALRLLKYFFFFAILANDESDQVDIFGKQKELTMVTGYTGDKCA